MNILFRTLAAGAFLSTRLIAASTEIQAPEVFRPVREFILEGLGQNRAPSVAVAVVVDDRLIWAEGFGLADVDAQRRASAESIYLLASVSKPITATGLMVLADEVKVDLDKPANDYLPQSKLRAVRGASDAITVRRLANHTSGLAIHYNFFYNGAEPPSRDETIRRYGIAYFPPGARVDYCNLAFGVLDYIVETVSATSWRRFMEARVYDPIGMASTSDHVRPGLGEFASGQYQMDLGGRFVRVAPYGFDHDGASAIWSSALDLSRFLRLHLNGGIVDGHRLLREETARSMLKPTGLRDPGKPEEGFGVAWAIGSHAGRRSFEHSGGMPGVSTRVRGFPDDDAGFVVLINASAGAFLEQISQRMTQALFPKAEPPAKTTQTRRPDKTSRRPRLQAGLWEGQLAHFEGDIPLALEIESNRQARVKLGSRDAVPLIDANLTPDRVTGFIRGTLKTQPSYHGPVNLEFHLQKVEGGWTGVAVAKADGYFALSHGVQLSEAAGTASAKEKRKPARRP